MDESLENTTNERRTTNNKTTTTTTTTNDSESFTENNIRIVYSSGRTWRSYACILCIVGPVVNVFVGMVVLVSMHAYDMI